MLSDILNESLRDRYHVQQELGRRAGRRTLLAHDRQTKKLVVIKLLLFNSEFEWDDLKLFEREAKTLQSLSHDAIPRYLDYFEIELPNGKGFALVQDYIKAKSLQEQIKAGRSFSESEIKQLAQSLLAILTYLHDRKPPIIHRDIKPSNVLLGDRSGNSVGQVYLVDFGSVQNLAAREGGTVTVVGTYGYMPPEQFGGRAVPASDLYSLGATLIYLVTGQHPADLPEHDLQIQFEQAANLSPTLTDWLKQMTVPSISKRFASVQEALQGLEVQAIVIPKNNKITVPFVKQPLYTKIKVSKNGGSLEIFIPRAKLNIKSIDFWFRTAMFVPGVLLLVLASTAVLYLIFALLSYGLSVVYSIVPLLLAAFLGLLGVMLVRPILEVILSKYIRLRFNSPIVPSAKLEFTDGRFIKYFSAVGSSCVILSRDLCRLTEEEFDWLKYEIENWYQSFF